ncbi:hypothetical protein PF001_g22951 [Phytophthora fragariae]|nr:hypothetical protein PF001_g22951 [Phytophthora fragariae]
MLKVNDKPETTLPPRHLDGFPDACGSTAIPVSYHHNRQRAVAFHVISTAFLTPVALTTVAALQRRTRPPRLQRLTLARFGTDSVVC